MIEANTLGRHAYGEDDTEALISKSTWSLKLSGLIFAGLLIIGRSASYGNIQWTPTFHPAGTPLTVIETTRPSTPNPAQVPKTLPSVDSAALTKRAAAAEVISFSVGKIADDTEGDSQASGQTGAGHTGANSQGSPGSAPQTGTSPAATNVETSGSAGSAASHAGSGNSENGAATANETSTSAGGQQTGTSAAATQVETSGSAGSAASHAGSGNSENGAGTANETSTSLGGQQTGTSAAATQVETSGS
ncbi:MAG: hypothetical protein E6I07_12295, partial [Chloroflexi bacterium]